LVFVYATYLFDPFIRPNRRKRAGFLAPVSPYILLRLSHALRISLRLLAFMCLLGLLRP